MAIAPLSDRFIQRHPFAETDKPIIVRDTNMKGLLLRVGRRSKKLVFQTEVKGRTVYRPLGDWDGESVTVDSARRDAGEFAQELRKGNKLASLRGRVTVKAAFDEYVVNLRARGSDRWADAAQGFYDRNFTHLADRKLASLSGETQEMVDLHNKITKERGPFEANRAMQTLRAAYRRARLLDKSKTIPADNPVVAFGMLGQWNDEPPAKKAIAFEDLAEWGRKVDAIEKETPIRAAFHRICLKAGTRPEELRKLQWATVDWKRRQFTLLDTKGGKGRARKRFPGGLDVTLPMTAAIEKEFKIAKAEGEIMFPNSPYVFPAHSESGHLMEWSQKTLPSTQVGNFGRHQYQSIGRALGIQTDAMDMLTGHVPSKSNVGANYGKSEHDIEQIKRPAQEKISKRICALLATKTKAPSKKRAARA